jgi:hypothetical protein
MDIKVGSYTKSNNLENTREALLLSRIIRDFFPSDIGVEDNDMADIASEFVFYDYVLDFKYCNSSNRLKLKDYTLFSNLATKAKIPAFYVIVREFVDGYAFTVICINNIAKDLTKQILKDNKYQNHLSMEQLVFFFRAVSQYQGGTKTMKQLKDANYSEKLQQIYPYSIKYINPNDIKIF